MPSTQELETVLSEPVCIIGAGPAGLITAHTLLKDGFKNVQVFTKDDSVGGVWKKGRVYPGLVINNVHGEYNFSSLPMPDTTRPDGRLGGDEINAYMEVFAHTYLKDKIQFGVKVVNLRRVAEGDRARWIVKLLYKKTGTQQEKAFKRVVLCTGGCSIPTTPADLSPSAAKSAGFSGLVLHTSHFREKVDEILDIVGPKETGGGADGYAGSVVIVGGGRSAQDIAAYLAKEGRDVTMVFRKPEAFVANPVPLPAWIRKSRVFAILSAHVELRSRLERFLHTTWIGNLILQLIWAFLVFISFRTAKVPANSPLRNTESFFWTIRANDEGVPGPDGFHAAVNAGKIALVTPAWVTGYYGGLSGGKSGKNAEGGVLVKMDGQIGPEAQIRLKASVIILATGYKSSWDGLFDAATAHDVGIAREERKQQSRYDHEWDHYRSLANPPPPCPGAHGWVSPIYRGIVPARNILRRDLAVNGATFSAGNVHTDEVSAHWISSYFLQDPLKLPNSVQEALEKTRRHAAWLKKRYPNTVLNQSYGSGIPFLTWPQTVDELLEDMYLPSWRSGGNWLTWPFMVIDIREIANLSKERHKLRQAALS